MKIDNFKWTFIINFKLIIVFVGATIIIKSEFINFNIIIISFVKRADFIFKDFFFIFETPTIIIAVTTTIIAIEIKTVIALIIIMLVAAIIFIIIINLNLNY